MSANALTMTQTVFYVVSPLITLLALSVAYLALLKQTKPHVLVDYCPDPGIQSFIHLVVENVGPGMARNVEFSKPLPARCFGIEKPERAGVDVLADGLPAIASGRKFVFDGGQYTGLSTRIGEKLELEVSYRYTNPLGLSRKRKERCVVSVSHLKHMSTRTSAEQAIVDALDGPNDTTLQRIEKRLSEISSVLKEIKENAEGRGDDAS
jgi:hypothetical protein